MKRQNKIKYNGGAAMMVLVLFFVFISLTILIGVVNPTIREYRVASDNYRSKQAYFLAESGIEDVIYRLKNSKQTSASETLILGDSTATTTITNINGNQKQISTLGDANSFQRKVDINLTTSSGVSFNYGIQMGRGGVTFGNNSKVVGNIYANGSLIGDGTITGMAIAADSDALVADQINETPLLPASSIIFRKTSSDVDFTQSFQVSESSPANKIQFYIKKVGSPANATVRLVTDNGGSPSTDNLLSSQGTLSASLVTTSYGWVEVVFANNPTLYPGTTYWVVIDNSTYSSSNYYIIGANDGVYTEGVPKVGTYAGSWNTTNPSSLDSYFRIYLGGLTSVIDGVTVEGDAWAHTITGGNVSGTKYCQIGTGCNTSRPDPTPVGFPVSEANILSWKEEAETGGEILGNYTVSSNINLGPKKITGNLIIGSGKTLTVTGPLWIEGNISTENNAIVRLSANYSSNDGVIISDGRVMIENNAIFIGSGTAGSYILVLTTSDCPISSYCNSADAIDVSNNAGAVILNAQKGTIHLSNNSGIVEATGEMMKLDNNATVTYESGLTDMNFNSGPSGSWSINSWKETE